MDRRTFLLLTGAASSGLVRPSVRGSERRTSLGRLRFEFDDRHRWSLWYRGDGPAVPLIEGATITAWVGDQPVTLADLQDITIGSRRPPGGDSIVIRGRAAVGGVVVEAEFFAGEEAAAPTGEVTVTLDPDRALPTVRGVRFFHVADTLPGEGPLVALVNGYHSWSPATIETVRANMPETTSHGAIGLTRSGRGLAVAFDAGEPGEAKVTLSPGGAGGLEAVSDWLPARPLRSEGDATTMHLCFTDTGDGLDALTALFQPRSPVDRERLAATTVPAGWCSWYELFGKVTEDDVVANLELCAATFDRRFFRLIQLDDGYQRATGDWETNDKFPHGHRWLTDRIHAKGFTAGLWIAPFAVSERSGIPAAHPDWLLKNATGPILRDTRDNWGGKIYSIDGAHPEVQQWLHDLARQVVQAWGYDYLKIDFLLWATGGDSHYGGMTHAEAYRRGLAAIREGLGPEAFLLGCGAPLQHAVGYVNGMRIGADVDASWGGLQAPARAAALRRFYHRGAWLNDPDCLLARPPLSLGEAQAWASVVALSGGLTVFSDNLPKLSRERLVLLQRTLPVTPVAGRVVDAFTGEPEVAPALLAGTDVYRIGGPWRFRTGDDPSYSRREYDEEAWETIPVPGNWEAAGHPGYDGFAWYRTRFTLPAARTVGQPGAPTVHLELGKIDDADETFINGVKVGQTGEFPPSYRSEWQAYRRYPVSQDALNWGGENVLAVRVYDGGGPGGWWSVRRERPPGTWVVEGAPRWWTAALVNWDEDARDVAVPLATLGITGRKFAAYDVWRDTPLPDLTTSLALHLDARSATTVAIRAALARPQVIGTSRHVVQGAVDIAEENWEATTRTLHGKSANLDGRAYHVTIAVPRGMRPGVCKAELPCTVSRLPSGHAVLKWEPSDGRDIQWEIAFRQGTARGARKSNT
jgi:hypothetical protein